MSLVTTINAKDDDNDDGDNDDGDADNYENVYWNWK